MKIVYIGWINTDDLGQHIYRYFHGFADTYILPFTKVTCLRYIVYVISSYDFLNVVYVYSIFVSMCFHSVMVLSNCV